MKKIYIILSALFFYVATYAQVTVVGTINTNGVANYPTHFDSLQKGGFRIVSDTFQRNSIPTLRRKYGMWVYSQSDSITYRLADINLGNIWVSVNTDILPQGSKNLYSQWLPDANGIHYYKDPTDPTGTSLGVGKNSDSAVVSIQARSTQQGFLFSNFGRSSTVSYYLSPLSYEVPVLTIMGWKDNAMNRVGGGMYIRDRPGTAGATQAFANAVRSFDIIFKVPHTVDVAGYGQYPDQGLSIIADQAAPRVFVGKQGVGDSSSMFDIGGAIDTLRGALLAPKFTTNQMMGIRLPAHGLVVINTDSTGNNYFVNTGTTSSPSWNRFGASVSGGSSSGIISQTVVTANGFSGTSTGGTTPAITLTTPLNTMVKGNSGAFVNAIPGTDYVIPSALASLAPLSSPALTGVPTAPTAALGTNTTQIATTSFVANAVAATKDSIKAGYLQVLDSVNIAGIFVKRIGVDSTKLDSTTRATITSNSVLLTTDQTVQGLKAWQGAAASDSATLSTTEMVPTGSGTNWAGSFPGGVTHTVGSTSPYPSTFTPTIGTSYVIITRNEVRTAGSATLTGGGIYTRAISGLYGDSRESFTAVTAAPIVLTSTTDYDGKMTVSIKVAGVTSPIVNINSSSSGRVNEFRYMGQTSQSWGINAGRRMLNTATNNLLLGNNAGASLVTGLGNVFLLSGASTTSGSYNFAAIVGAMAANITGAGNIVIGNNSFNNNLSGSLNLVLGHRSVQYILDGSTPATNINNGVYLGGGQRASAINATGETLIGYGAYGIANNTMVLGGSTQVNTTIPYGTFTVPNLTGGSATDSVVTQDATGLFHKRSGSAYAGGGGSVVTVAANAPLNITGTASNPIVNADTATAGGLQTKFRTDSARTNLYTVIATHTANIASNTTAIAGKESTLGNPSTSGYILSSTTGGVRSWIAPAAGGGGVSSLSIATANGFSGTSSGGTTPVITLTTPITGILKGNGTAISAAIPGTDFGRVDSIRFVNNGLLHTSSTAFSLSGNTAVLTQTLVNQTAGTVLSGPPTGGASAPTFRAIVPTDIPTLNQNTSGNALTATTVSTINGFVIQGTGVTITGAGTIASPYVINATGTTGTEVFAEKSTSLTGTTLTLLNTPILFKFLFKNGVLINPTDDYTISGATITLVVARLSTDKYTSNYKY